MVVENELVIERRTINRENRRYQDKSTNNEDKRRNQFAGLPPNSLVRELSAAAFEVEGFISKETGKGKFFDNEGRLTRRPGLDEPASSFIV